MKSLYLLSVFTALLPTLVLSKVSYAGAKAIRIAVGEDVTVVADLIAKLSLPIWKGAPGGIPMAGKNVDLVVAANKIAAFEAATKGLVTDVMHEDLGASIDEESSTMSTQVAAAAVVANSTWFNAYHTYADHLLFLSSLQSQYPSNAEIVTAGNSNAGRPITGIHFYGSGGKGSKPAVVLHGTVHAREWITTMTVEYLAWYLLSNYATNADVKSYVDKYDFYIFPVVNPDGFVYTQTTDRLWRKNRQTLSTSSCVGRDINRNWPFKWEVAGGASTNPCDEVYKGVVAGDATENKVLRNYLDNLAAGKGVQLFIDVHAYSQLFMSPYGYSCTALPLSASTFARLNTGVAAAIKAVYGTTFKAGPVCTTIYQATGSSVDYVNDVTKSKYSFTIELRDTGTYGFLLPASQILPTSVETWAGFKYLLVNMV